MAPMPGLEASWRSLEMAGGVIALLGVLGILFSYVTGLSISLLLGGLLVVGALIHVAHAIRARGGKGFVWQAILAIVYAFAGVSLLANPTIGLATLTILLITYFLVSGIVETVMGIRLRGEPSRVWVVASGVLSIVLAVLLWAGFPGTANWAVGLLFGISMLSTGISMFMVGRGAHRQYASGEMGSGTMGA